MQIYLDEKNRESMHLSQHAASSVQLYPVSCHSPPPPQLGVIPVADYSMVLFETTTEIKSILSWSGLSVP